MPSLRPGTRTAITATLNDVAKEKGRPDFGGAGSSVQAACPSLTSGGPGRVGPNGTAFTRLVWATSGCCAPVAAPQIRAVLPSLAVASRVAFGLAPAQRVSARAVGSSC
jgi:hypothetical protein